MIKNENCLPTSLRTKRRIVSPGEFKRKERHWAVGEKERRVLGLVWFCFDLVGVGFFFCKARAGGAEAKRTTGNQETSPPPQNIREPPPPHRAPKKKRFDSPFLQNYFFSSFLGVLRWRETGGGGIREGLPAASSWGERGWEIHRVPPLTPSLSSPFVDHRSSLVTLRPARLCNTSLAIQTQHPPPPTSTTTTITELSWACTGLAWAPELHL